MKYINLWLVHMCLLLLVAGCANQAGSRDDPTPTMNPTNTLPPMTNPTNTLPAEPVETAVPSATTVPTEASPTPVEDNQDWRSYVNARYNFTIQFPPSWPEGVESDNGDGIQLFVENPDSDIRVYAAHVIEGISEPYGRANQPGFQQQRIQLNSGREATLIIGDTNGRVHYEMVIVADNIEYHFYANVTAQFYQSNESTLQAIVKSFALL
jgi:hypothetical protein